MIELRALAAPPATVEETAPVLRTAATAGRANGRTPDLTPSLTPGRRGNSESLRFESPKTAVESRKTVEPKPKPPVEPVADRVPAAPEPPRDVVKPPAVKTETAISPAELARAARPTSGGASSLTRALGLKLNRIVLDAGHGGHDQGTAGPKGLLEKDLVLDVTLRLGKLIEQGMGAEVIYTRSDDTFVAAGRPHHDCQ